MELRTLISLIAQEFKSAAAESLNGHPLANAIRSESTLELERILGSDSFTFTGSPGQGNWAEIPWIGVFHPEITDSATHGFYVVYLFSRDLSTVYLCLGQGVTKIRLEFKKQAEDEMLRRAALIRDRIPEQSTLFLPGPISLGGSTRLAKDYDPAVSFFRKYDATALPSQLALESDLREMTYMYQLLVARGGTDNVESVIELNQDDSGNDQIASIEEQRRYIRHLRIERNSRAAKEAKKIHGFTCQGCGFSFQAAYGNLGRLFIEAHHLIPLSTLLEGEKASMRPEHDFAVLCANCHRIVHRSDPCLTIDELRSLPGIANLRDVLQAFVC